MRPAPVSWGRDDPVVLIAHGSRDPRAAAATRALARAVAAARPGLIVHDTYLDHTTPKPGRVLHELAAAGHRGATVVPLLLTAAYHGRVDIPAVLRTAREAGLRLPVRVSDVLGPIQSPSVHGHSAADQPDADHLAAGHPDAGHPDVDHPDELLLAGLRRRLVEASTGPFDAVVLAAAGTRDATARGTVEQAAAALGARLGVPCLAAYASAAPPTAGAAVARLRAAGARRVAVSAYFLAPGRLYENAMASAREAGAVAFATALEAAPEIARLVLVRADGAALASGPRVAA